MKVSSYGLLRADVYTTVKIYRLECTLGGNKCNNIRMLLKLPSKDINEISSNSMELISPSRNNKDLLVSCFILLMYATNTKNRPPNIF